MEIKGQAGVNLAQEIVQRYLDENAPYLRDEDNLTDIAWEVVGEYLNEHDTEIEVDMNEEAAFVESLSQQIRRAMVVRIIINLNLNEADYREQPVKQGRLIEDEPLKYQREFEDYVHPSH